MIFVFGSPSEVVFRTFKRMLPTPIIIILVPLEVTLFLLRLFPLKQGQGGCFSSAFSTGLDFASRLLSLPFPALP